MALTQELVDRLMRDFGRGFFRADRKLLERCTTPDFEWHLHVGDEPEGQVLRGLDEVIDEIERRKRVWRDVRYSDVEVSFTDSLIVQTFRVGGTSTPSASAKGGPLDARGVDLYPIRDQLILRKDSYWKLRPGTVKGAEEARPNRRARCRARS